MTNYARPSDIISNYICAIRNKYPLEIKVNDVSKKISYIKPDKNDEELLDMSKSIVEILTEAVKIGDITSYLDEEYLIEEMSLLIDLLLTVRNNRILEAEENTGGC